MHTFRIQTLNSISAAGLERLPRERYEIASEIPRPDALLLRSFDMHGMNLPSSIKAVARAGVGVNNIPVEQLTRQGIPVFNAPGANANAVKELVLTGILMAARNVPPALHFVAGMASDDDEAEQQMEAKKKAFVGFELPGRTLGVIGLGAIGVQVASLAVQLGMQAAGFDTAISVMRAWQLSSAVRRAASVGDLLAQSDVVSVHVPFSETTQRLINADRLRVMRRGSMLLNFARAGVVDEVAVRAALDDGHLHAYVTDFPRRIFRDHPRVIAFPHIGASTGEAEENCARIVADQLRAFLEDGVIGNSVNFPDVEMPRTEGFRLAVVNANVPNMLGQISTTLANAGQNIIDMLNKSRGDIAYTLTDVEQPLSDAVLDELRAIDGVLNVRAV